MVKRLGYESTACLCLSAVTSGQAFVLQLFKISLLGLVDMFNFHCSVSSKHSVIGGKKNMDGDGENKERGKRIQ